MLTNEYRPNARSFSAKRPGSMTFRGSTDYKSLVGIFAELGENAHG